MTMTFRRPARLLLAALALALPLALVSAPAEATTICRCSAISFTTTSNVPLSWGMGPTCSAATSNLDANTADLADLECLDRGFEGQCYLGPLQITTACHSSMGQIQVDGKRDYRCLVCFDIDQQQ
ncbi:MAG: hypothetical protein U0002_17960 [Thermoanaerobaculia bacterium]